MVDYSHQRDKRDIVDDFHFQYEYNIDGENPFLNHTYLDVLSLFFSVLYIFDDEQHLQQILSVF